MRPYTSRPRTPVSVCMAVHNGLPFLHEQLESIFSELCPTDELVIVDDASHDGSYEALAPYRHGRGRVIVLRNAVNRGHRESFRLAISLSSRPIVVLSDQDDRWPEGRLDHLLSKLDEPSVKLAFGSLAPLNGHGEELRTTETRLSGPLGVFKFAVTSNPSYGSASAFCRDAIDCTLPILTETHEQWLIAQALTHGSVAYSQGIVTLRRIHPGNLTVRRSFPARIRARVESLVSMLFVYRLRHRSGWDR